jgi:hypothetical protein
MEFTSKTDVLGRIDSLKDEHFSFEIKIEEIRRKAMLSTNDHITIKNLKKLKLKTKDKIEELNYVLRKKF